MSTIFLDFSHMNNILLYTNINERKEDNNNTNEETQRRTDLSRGLVHYDGAALSKALTSKPKHRTERLSRENRPARILDVIGISIDQNTTLQFT